MDKRRQEAKQGSPKQGSDDDYDPDNKDGWSEAKGQSGFKEDSGSTSSGSKEESNSDDSEQKLLYPLWFR